jgi:hypothetical protein
LVFALDRLGKHPGLLQGIGKRRASSTRQVGETAPRTRQGTRWWKQELGTSSTERDERNLIAADIAVCEQQLHSALGLGKPMQRCRPRRINNEDRDRLALLLQAANTKVVGLNNDATT